MKRVEQKETDKIIVDHLTKDYGHGRGIFDVSFSVKEGEVFGFLGPNGAGKSTTMRHLMGFSKPQKGRYSIGLSGVFVGICILAGMMGMFGALGVDSLENFKYATLFSLYDYKSVLLGTNDWVAKTIVAFVIGMAGYVIGGVRFCKKDLPL